MTGVADAPEGAPSDLDWESLFALLGRAHTHDVICVMVIENEPPLRFNELQDPLDLSPNTLSRRLDELESAGFLVRHSYDEIPPRAEYEPTEQLYALEPAVRELSLWLEKYGEGDPYDFAETNPSG